MIRLFNNNYSVPGCLLLLGLFVSKGIAHESPINLFVDETTNRMFVPPTFAAGRLSVQTDDTIATTTPGIGVTLLSNGLDVGTELIVDAMSGFYYFDGAELRETSASMTWLPPVTDNIGNPTGATGELEFFTTSPVQLGLPWATYVKSFFWEADGTHTLVSPEPLEVGLYGAVIRMRSTDHLASIPFLVPFVYDLETTWDFATEQAAVAAMRAAVIPELPGDFDGDLSYTCLDLDALTEEIVASGNNSMFDLNGDGIVSTKDLNAWMDSASVHNLLSGQRYLSGDANLDGVVDVGDFNLWNANKFTERAGWCRGDFNTDGFVDVGDFNIWNSNKFQLARPRVVPEPELHFLLLLCAACLALRLRRAAS